MSPQNPPANSLLPACHLLITGKRPLRHPGLHAAAAIAGYYGAWSQMLRRLPGQWTGAGDSRIADAFMDAAPVAKPADLGEASLIPKWSFRLIRSVALQVQFDTVCVLVDMAVKTVISYRLDRDRSPFKICLRSYRRPQIVRSRLGRPRGREMCEMCGGGEGWGDCYPLVLVGLAEGGCARTTAGTGVADGRQAGSRQRPPARRAAGGALMCGGRRLSPACAQPAVTPLLTP
jgi:hypothetical protein